VRKRNTVLKRTCRPGYNDSHFFAISANLSFCYSSPLLQAHESSSDKQRHKNNANNWFSTNYIICTLLILHNSHTNSTSGPNRAVKSGIQNSTCDVIISIESLPSMAQGLKSIIIMHIRYISWQMIRNTASTPPPELTILHKAQWGGRDGNGSFSYFFVTHDPCEPSHSWSMTHDHGHYTIPSNTWDWEGRGMVVLDNPPLGLDSKRSYI